MIMGLKRLAHSRGPMQYFFLGFNHAGSRTRDGAPHMPGLEAGREEKEKGKKKKSVVPPVNTS